MAGQHGVAAWRRVLIVHHAVPPTSEMAKHEIALLTRLAGDDASGYAVVATIDSVFPPPGRHVQTEYGRALRDHRPGVLVTVARERGFAASILRSMLVSMMSIATGLRFEIVTGAGEAAARLADDFADGDRDGLRDAIEALSVEVRA